MPSHSIRIDYDVEMTTRDGVTLRSDVIRPDEPGRYPAILARTPYSKGAQFDMQRHCSPVTAARAGFAYVIQDIRGRFGSEGEWDFLDLTAANQEDGYDAIEWVASQPWCDGHVGMAGGSYVAETQMAAASANPPSLGCIAPALMGMGKERALSQGLPLESMTVGWMSGLAVDKLLKLLPAGQASFEDLMGVLQAMTRPDLASQILPLNDLSILKSHDMPGFELTERLVENAAKHKGTEETRWTVPALWTSGWYDNAGGAEQFCTMRQKAASEVARTDTRLIMGAWTHNYAMSFVGAFGLGGLGSAEGGGIPALHLRFYDRHLRGADADLAPVRYFVMRANLWREAQEWPIPGTEVQRWYLHSRGSAATSESDGVLSLDAPSASEPEDIYTSDPHDPVPSWGFRVMYTGGTTVAGPFDQHRVEQRDDVLVYTSAPFERDTEVVGDIRLQLFIASSAVDTDFIAKLCVVWPDGTSINLADGKVRALRRNGYDAPAPLNPGEVVPVTVELGPTGYLFEAGTRLRVQIASTAFPHWARNLQTGNGLGDDAVGVVARNSVFHTDTYASYLELPVQVDPPPMVPPPLPF
jgi:putative CocE/NonD family hydrolase